MGYSFLEGQTVSLVVNATNGRGHYSVIGRATIINGFLSVKKESKDYIHIIYVKTGNIDSAARKMRTEYAWLVEAHARL